MGNPAGAAVVKGNGRSDIPSPDVGDEFLYGVPRLAGFHRLLPGVRLPRRSGGLLVPIALPERGEVLAYPGNRESRIMPFAIALGNADAQRFAAHHGGESGDRFANEHGLEARRIVRGPVLDFPVVDDGGDPVIPEQQLVDSDEELRVPVGIAADGLAAGAARIQGHEAVDGGAADEIPLAIECVVGGVGFACQPGRREKRERRNEQASQAERGGEGHGSAPGSGVTARCSRPRPLRPGRRSSGPLPMRPSGAPPRRA